MTQEDKKLLLKDLCSRLPYGVKVNNVIQGDFEIYGICENFVFGRNETCHIDFDVEKIKPYLFPLSSMSEEQKKYIDNRWGINEDFDFEIDPNWGRYVVDLGDAIDFVNWLIENHFDIYGLIPKDLALDASGLKIY